jgi:hypothetical protein
VAKYSSRKRTAQALITERMKWGGLFGMITTLRSVKRSMLLGSSGRESASMPVEASTMWCPIIQNRTLRVWPGHPG